MGTDDSGRSSMISDHSSAKYEYVMTQVQRDWYVSSATRDFKKMTNLLKDNPELANWKSYIDGNTALHYAAKFGDNSLVYVLAGNYKADVHAQDHTGRTPLHLAAAGAHSEVIHTLRSRYNARSDVLDYYGHPPCYYLPNTKAGEALKRFLRDPLQVLLSQPDSPLRLLLPERPPAIRVQADVAASASEPALGPPQQRPELPSPQTRQLFVNRLPFNQSFPWSSSEAAARGSRAAASSSENLSVGRRPTVLERSMSPETPAASCNPLVARRLLNSSLLTRIRGRSVDSAGTGDRSRSSSRQRRPPVETAEVSTLEAELNALLRRRRAYRQQQTAHQKQSPPSATHSTLLGKRNSSGRASLGSSHGSPIAHN